MMSNFWGDDEYPDTVNSWYPSADVMENKNDYTLKIELPGVMKDQVKISVQDNVLTIQGEKQNETESKDTNYHRVERSYGKFLRSFRLPSAIKSDKIDATYKDGILSIVLPKAEEAKTKEIEIKF